MHKSKSLQVLSLSLNSVTHFTCKLFLLAQPVAQCSAATLQLVLTPQK